MDVVYVEAIELSATIGSDWWSRVRPQPISVSVYLHLNPSHLDLAGTTDDVADSIHYGHLCKSITALAQDPQASFASAHDLARQVAEAAIRFAGDVVTYVRVVIGSSKLIPLALTFELEMVVHNLPPSASENAFPAGNVRVRVNGLTLATIIGVNPPEREAKQRVITNITIVEKDNATTSPDYPQLISQIAKDIEASSYLTLEKFVYEIVRTACLSSQAVDTVTVHAEKPSALSFASVSGVQITRPRDAFLAA